MAISISNRPDKTINSYNSYWVAVNNPVSFSFETTGSPADDAVQVALFEVDGFTQIVELSIIPFPPSSIVTIDISSFIQSETNSDDDSFTIQINADNVASNQFKVFRIGYRADGNGSYTVDSTEYIGVNNVKQALETYGGNLAKYVPDFDSSGATAVNREGEFLSTLERPKIFWFSSNDSSSPPSNQVTTFYPSIAWILPDEYDGQTDYDVRTTKDGGGAVIGSFPLVSPAEKGIRYVNWRSSIPSNDDTYTAKTITTEIQTTAGDCLVSPISYDVVRVCNNPIAIKWKDKLGSWQIWVFEGDAVNGVNVTSGDNVAIPYTDIATLSRSTKTLTKTEIPTLTVSANLLTKNEVIALQGIQTSPHVLLCVSDFRGIPGEDADDWASISVIDATRPLYNERLAKYGIAFEFELIESFTINN